MKGLIVLKGSEAKLDGAPETIKLLPLGHVKSQKGTFTVDKESFDAIEHQFKNRGVDIVIDYEHQTHKDVQAPAAGWIKELFLSDDAISARVEWTDTARKYLENKEYRYLSPAILVRKSDGKAIALYSAGLTNTPAIDGMFPILNSFSFTEGGEESMDLLKKIASLLGLGEDATEEQVTAALGTMVDEAKKAKEGAAAQEDGAVVQNKAVCELLGLKADAPAVEVTAKITELKAAVSGQGFDSEAELKALKANIANRDADDAVLLALKEGKISAAQKDWAKSYALESPKGFAAFVEKAPQVVPMGETGFETKTLKDEAPDEATLLACKLTGISEDDLKKYGGIK